MKVLIAEDSAVTRGILEVTLEQWGHEVVACAGGLEAWQVLAHQSEPLLVVLDWIMPGLDGIEVCRRARARANAPGTYILLLTVKKWKHDFAIGLQAGADDYITKPFDMDELRVRLQTGQRILELQSALHAAQEKQAESLRDPLTHAWSHDAIIDILQREIERARRESTSVGVLLGDVDDLRGINEKLGHAGGDAVLREVAGRIRASIRPYDTIGRFGSDEFLIILPGCDAAKTRLLAERIHHAVRDHAVHTGSVSLRVALSLGAASHEAVPYSASAAPPVQAPELELAAEKLLRTAQDALDAARAQAQNASASNAPDANASASNAPDAKPPTL